LITLFKLLWKKIITRATSELRTKTKHKTGIVCALLESGSARDFHCWRYL